MLDSAKQVFSTVLAVAAVLVVLWIIGVVNVHGAHGMAAVGDGIAAIFKAAAELISHIKF
jgi:hypothetical protein